MLKNIFLLYLCVINILAVIFCIYDKLAAIRQKRRVAEKTLFWIVGLGGGVGMYLTMRLIRHKTLHKRFMVGIPLILLLQAALAYTLIYLTK